MDYFDAVKIGLTATPALHTTEIFGLPIFDYSYREAVIDGYLVDHEPPVQIRTKLSNDGIVWRAGESVAVYRPDRKQIDLYQTPDEIKIEEFNRKVITEPDALRRLPFDRQARRYRDATDWARWILSLLSPKIRAGANTAPGLLFDMNLLFQSSVANVLRREFERTPDVRLDTQDVGRHLAVVAADGQGAFALRPDIVIRRGTDVLAVLDTKWKRLRGHKDEEFGVASADA